MWAAVLSVALYAIYRAAVLLRAKTPPRITSPTSTAIHLKNVTQTPYDKDIMIWAVLHDWSFREAVDGDFVAPQGIFTSDVCLQVESSQGRDKVSGGKVIYYRPSDNIARVLENGTTFHIKLGRPLQAFAEFCRSCRAFATGDDTPIKDFNTKDEIRLPL